MGRTKKAPTNNSFGKGTEVICKLDGHIREGERGTINTGEPNKEGEFEVKFVGDSGRTEYTFIHGNDLELAVDVEPTYAARQDGDSAEEETGRPYIITKAKIKDDFCHYSYEHTRGISAGEEHNVKVDNIITPDMKYAFERFNVHLAVIDDVFKHSKVEFDDIDTMHNDEHTMLYHVTGFQISGNTDNESIVLTGSKYLSAAGGRMDITTPKIPLDNLSSYKWYNELKAAADAAREEVALYKEGKYEAPVEKEAKPNPKQMKIGEGMDQEEGPDSDNEGADDELENAKF